MHVTTLRLAWAGLLVGASALASGPTCLDPLLDIRGDARAIPPDRDRFEYVLAANVGFDTYRLTFETLGDRRDHRVRAHVVRDRAHHDALRTRLRDIVADLPAACEELIEEPHFRCTLRFTDELDLRVRLALAHERLAALESTWLFEAEPLREWPDPYTERGSLRIIEAFVRDRVQRAPSLERQDRLDLRRRLLDELTPREETFFDWGIFVLEPGARAIARAKLIAAKWRTVDPASPAWAEVHDRIRAKLTRLARAKEKPKSPLGLLNPDRNPSLRNRPREPR